MLVEEMKDAMVSDVEEQVVYVGVGGKFELKAW